MKKYEDQTERDGYIAADMPFILRLDGHKFNTFTRAFQHPYDTRLAEAMIGTTKDLFRTMTSASCAYVASDEISLFFPAAVDEAKGKGLPADLQTLVSFRGRLQKTASLCAGLASARFNARLRDLCSGADGQEVDAGVVEAVARSDAHFDCRACSLPSYSEAAAYIVWRADDCVRNSKMMLAQAHMTPAELHGVPSDVAVATLLDRSGIDWKAQPEAFRFGTTLKFEQYNINGWNPREQCATAAVRRRLKQKTINWQTWHESDIERVIFAPLWPE